MGRHQRLPPGSYREAVLSKTCKALQLSDIDDAFTDIVATSIVELAKTGERDPDRLCSQALDALSASRESSEDKSTKQVGLSK